MVEIFNSRPIQIIEKEGDPIKILEGQRKHKEDKIVKPNLERFKETEFSLRHEKVKDRVLSILREDKYSRIDDFYLCLLYWIKTGQIEMKVDFKDFKKITKPESISRCRREIFTMAKKDQKLKFLLENQDFRKDEEENYHNYFQDKKLSREAESIK